MPTKKESNQTKEQKNGLLLRLVVGVGAIMCVCVCVCVRFSSSTSSEWLLTQLVVNSIKLSMITTNKNIKVMFVVRSDYTNNRRIKFPAKQ